MNISLITKGRCCIFLLCLFPGLAWSYSLSIAGPTEAAPGDLLTYTVNLDDTTDLISADFRLNYNPLVLDYQQTQPGFELDPSWDSQVANPTTVGGSGVIVITATPFGMPLEPLSLALLDFQVLGGALLGPTALYFDITPTALSPTNLGKLLPGFEVENIVPTTSGMTTTIVPILPAWLLALSGLSILGWFRRSPTRTN